MDDLEEKASSIQNAAHIEDCQKGDFPRENSLSFLPEKIDLWQKKRSSHNVRTGSRTRTFYDGGERSIRDIFSPSAETSN